MPFAMKKQRLFRFPLVLMILFSLTLPIADARIRFDQTVSIEIDLKNLDIRKQTFLDYVTRVVHEKPFGLQAYGQVPFKVCEMKHKGRQLLDYQTTEGRKVRFMSNPSCDQLVLQRLLKLDYNYQPDDHGFYQNRKCIRSIEEIFSPLLEYYTIRYEEKTRPDCERCDAKERHRLSKISGIQEKIVKNCKAEQDNVIRFLTDLDATIENAFQSKPRQSAE